MPTPPNVINVPKPAPGSYRPDRPAGLLLKSQTLHLHAVLLQHRKELDAILAIDPRSLKTEADVSAYIHKATAILHTHNAVSPRK
jgi:hypothetical protein